MNPALAILVSAMLCLSSGGRGLSSTGTGDPSSSMFVNGIRRTFLVHLPPNNVLTTPRPLLLVLHGGGGTGSGMLKLTYGEFDSLSDKEGFIVVYPDGVGKRWNDARIANEARDRAHEENIDDVGFISALIDSMVTDREADPRRVYVTGMSNGAIMSFRLACELSNKIAAIAAVDGGIPVHGVEHCSAARHVSVLMINGTEDPLVHWGGGEVTGPFGFKKLGKLLSPLETVQFWVKRDHCGLSPDSTEEPDIDPGDGTRVLKTDYAGGLNGSEVILYIIEGGGHTWPGGLQYLPKWIVGRTCRDIDACQIIWDFFRNRKRE